MKNSTSAETGEFLLQQIANREISDFAKVMAIWSLEEMGTPEQLARLKKMARKLSDEPARFDADIMDPRICTSLPSPRVAAAQKG